MIDIKGIKEREWELAQKARGTRQSTYRSEMLLNMLKEGRITDEEYKHLINTES